LIDIHSHVIYGVDDGSRSLEQSLEMLALAAAHGTTDLVASPHANSRFPYQKDVNLARLAELQAAEPRVRLHLGCDFHLTYENVLAAVADPAFYSINGHGYLLVEFPDTTVFKQTEEILAHLQHAGLVPIITHPERSWVLQQHFDRLAAWVKHGSLIQVTGQSLTGRFGTKAQQFAEKLIQAGLVHFVASDAHDAQDRTPRLDTAYETITQRWDAALAGLLLEENPRAVLDGKPVTPPKPRRKKLFGWL
jgi:protein-tyrosine phosphatase